MSCSLHEKWYLMETDLAVKYIWKIELLCFKNFWEISAGSKFDQNETFTGNFNNCARVRCINLKALFILVDSTLSSSSEYTLHTNNSRLHRESEKLCTRCKEYIYRLLYRKPELKQAHLSLKIDCSKESS